METPNMRERVRDEETSVIEFSKHFESAGDVEVSPAEKVRFEENQKFANVIMDELNFLIRNPFSITPEQVREKSESICGKLSPDQVKVFSSVVGQIESDLQFPKIKAWEDFLTWDYKKIQEAHPDFFPVIQEESVTFTSLGYPVAVVSQSEMDRVFGSDQNGLTNFRPFLADSGKNYFLEKIIFVNENPKGSTREKVIEHEYFHKLYVDYLRQNTLVRYEDDLEKAVFQGIKDELLAQLVEGRWQFRLSHLLRKDFQKLCLKIEDNSKTSYELQWDILRSIRKEIPEEDAFFMNEIGSVIVQLSRLFVLGSEKFQEGIQRIITCQGFKEIAYNLSTLDEGIIDCEKIVKDFNPTNLKSVGGLLDKLNLIGIYSLKTTSKDMLVDTMKELLSNKPSHFSNGDVGEWHSVYENIEHTLKANGYL